MHVRQLVFLMKNGARVSKASLHPMVFIAFSCTVLKDKVSDATATHLSLPI